MFCTMECEDCYDVNCEHFKDALKNQRKRMQNCRKKLLLINNSWLELKNWLDNYRELLLYKPDVEENAQIDLLEEILEKMKEIEEKNNG